ncbi:LacI family DNA-binding transcriptional regulator [Streptomyces sp. NPDC091292]|uniref:LacI family DNA-binding transcriptional regulator n=1 Tax=Streptomyces sp. NPDC091292 TaxID=3365991 RepID=UPI00380BDE96
MPSRPTPPSRGEPPKPTTLADVAAAAGVAISTVSRTFSNPGRVNATTREHVEQAARRLGYRPNAAARALESGRTSTLGVIVSDITNPHFFTLIRGAQHQATTAGYTLLLGDAHLSRQAEQQVIERTLTSVDGLVVAASRLPTAQLADYARVKPIVLVNRVSEGLSSVVTDHTDGPRQIVEHLHSLGHRHLAFLGGPRESWSAAKRWSAIAASALDLGVTITRLGPFPAAIEGGGAAADAALGTRATALIAHNDLLAIGALRRLAERGVAVPDDVSVTGFDDIFGADFCAPPLTTLAAPLDDAGRQAVDLLIAAATRRAGPPQRLTLPAHLQIRGSTGPAPKPAGHRGSAAPAG